MPVGVPDDVDDVLVGVTAGVPWFVVCHIEKQTTTERRDGQSGTHDSAGNGWSGRTATYAYFNSSILVSLVSPACLRNSARTIVRSACALGLCWWRAEAVAVRRRRASESRQRQGKRNRGSGAAAVGMMNGYEIKHVLTYVAGQVHDRPEAVPVQLQARSRRPVHGERLLPN